MTYFVWKEKMALVDNWVAERYFELSYREYWILFLRVFCFQYLFNCIVVVPLQAIC